MVRHLQLDLPLPGRQTVLNRRQRNENDHILKLDVLLFSDSIFYFYSFPPGIVRLRSMSGSLTRFFPLSSELQIPLSDILGNIILRNWYHKVV